jgi:hypothetical protein
MTANWDKSIESLTKRYEELNKRKITADANLKHANDQLNELKQKAKDQFGTDDLDVLREKLADMERDNERIRVEYEQHLTEIEQNLASVEASYKQGATH